MNASICNSECSVNYIKKKSTCQAKDDLVDSLYTNNTNGPSGCESDGF